MLYYNESENHLERFNFILDTQKIHKALRFTKEALDNSGTSTILMPPQNHQVVDASTIKAKVLICGRMSYISGPVGEKGKTEEWKVPNMALPQYSAPSRTWMHNFSKMKRNLYRACGLKVVSPFSAEKFNISFRKVVPWVWEMGEISRADSTVHFEQALQFARFAVLESGVGNCQLAIGESG